MRWLATVLTAGSLLAVGCGDGEPDDYTLQAEQAFVDRCAEEADRAACRCIWQRIVDEMPYNRFVELDRQRGDDPSFVPPELETFALDCAIGLAE